MYKWFLRTLYVFNILSPSVKRTLSLIPVLHLICLPRLLNFPSLCSLLLCFLLFAVSWVPHLSLAITVCGADLYGVKPWMHVCVISTLECYFCR